MMAVDEKNRVLMVRQYRLPAERYMWELPAGKVAAFAELTRRQIQKYSRDAAEAGLPWAAPAGAKGAVIP